MKHLTESPQHSQDMLTGWGCRRKGTCSIILLRAVFRSTPWPILHSTLVLALKGSLQVLSCKGLFLQLTGDIKSLWPLPHQQAQEKGEARFRHSIYHFKFSSYFPLHRGGGRWGSPWPSPPVSVPSAQIWDWGGRNSIKGRPFYRVHMLKHNYQECSGNYEQAWTLSKQRPTSNFLPCNNKNYTMLL